MAPNRIRELRRAKGMRQRELAERCGLSESTISGMETGERTVSDKRLAAIADALGVTVLELLTEPPIQLSEDETRIIKLMRELPEDQRRRVVDLWLALTKGGSNK